MLNMKKFLTSSVFAFLVLFLAACGGGDKNEDTANEAADTENTAETETDSGQSYFEDTSLYVQTGDGMGDTLRVAAEKGGYVLTDRATYLAQKENYPDFEILVEGSEDLKNIYHVMQVNPEKNDMINSEGAEAFVEFLTSEEIQNIIAEFGKEEYGQPLFYKDADEISEPKAEGKDSKEVTDLILATTTSTQDSGLLDELLPIFHERYPYNIKTIAVGTGQALEMGVKGEADVLLTHAPASEQELVDNGDVINYKKVMYNDYIIAGPADDPSGIKGSEATEALKKIVETKGIFVSRGDDSGTHKKELSIWEAAGFKVQE